MAFRWKARFLLLCRFKVFPAVVAQGADIILGQLALAGLEVAADGADIALPLVDNGGDHMLEIVLAVLAQRADEILRQLAALV